MDWETVAEDYEIEECPDYGEYWAFQGSIGALNPYIAKWAAAKKAAKKGTAEREHAKRMLNASYGRFALKPDTEKVTLGPNDDGDLAWITELERGDPQAYLPYAMFTTAWARSELMKRVRKVVDAYGVDAVIHSDTDSVIYRGEPLGGYGKEIGDWDLESTPDEMLEGGFKRYVEVFHTPEGTKYNMACAGVPQPKHADGVPYGMQLEILDKPSRIFGGILGHEHYKLESEWLRKLYKDSGRNPDDVNTLKLIPVKCPGGVILEGRQHEIDSDGLQMRLFRCI